MLNINECKKILNENQNLYSDEEIIIIRDWLYHMADIALNAPDKCQTENFNED